MKNFKVKIVVGFRQDQVYTIEADEAHKAYYLFLNPDERGIFKNGVAVRGADIQSIVPDYHASMGWNPSHLLNDDDWNEIKGKGVDLKLRDILILARNIAQFESPEKMSLPLSELLSNSQLVLNEGTKKLAEKFKIN